MTADVLAPLTPGAVRPLYAPVLKPGTPHLGGRVAGLSAGLGRPFMPWQKYVSRVINEIDPVTGLRTRSFIVLTVQRQAGKTTTVLSEALERCLFGRPAQRVWYTAQTGAYAAEKWAEMATQLMDENAPLRGYISVKWSNGSQCMTFPDGSTFRPFSPTKAGLHSRQSDLVLVDEGWAHSTEKGEELMAGISPTQATRPGAQVIVLSTMGDATSTWLHGLVDAGRLSPDDPGMTYVEYGIGPDGDPGDMDQVIGAHPAVGHTITPEFILGERRRLSPGEFARAYGNARTRTENRFIDVNVWAAGATRDVLPAGRPVFGAAVALDGSRTAIVGAVAGVLEVVESRPGSDWAAGRVLELVEKHDAPAVFVAAAGPSSVLFDRLVASGKLGDRLVDAGKFAAVAAARFMDRLRRPDGDPDALRYRSASEEIAGYVDDAADSAVPRNRSDDGWTWGRRISGGPIPEIEAMTWAGWADEHRPSEAPRPVVYS